MKDNEQFSEYDLHGAHCLLADDDPHFKFIVAKYLQNWNAKVDFADDGVDAVNKVKTHKYDFVLMDINMPKMDGLECTVSIRELQDDYFKKLPIIGLSIITRRYWSNEIAEAGLNDCIDKKFNPKEFYKTIVSCLNQ